MDALPLLACRRLCSRGGFGKGIFTLWWVKRDGEKVGNQCGEEREESRANKLMLGDSVIAGVFCIGVGGILTVIGCCLLSVQKLHCVLRTS